MAEGEKPPVWHGTEAEYKDLKRAVERNCTCVTTLAGVRLSICPSHKIIEQNQRVLDGLLFARRIRKRLEDEEFCRPITP